MDLYARVRRAVQVKTDVDGGVRAGVPSDMAEKMKALEREVRELRQTINGLYNAEVIHRRRPWRFFETQFASLEQVDWFNNRRLWSRLATSPRQRPHNVTTPHWIHQLWARNSNETASDIPGAVQDASRERPSCSQAN